MKRRAPVTRHGNLVRASQWHGVTTGDGVKERRQHWVFVAHVLNDSNSEEWIEVRGGRSGEAKSRSFRPEAIYPSGAKRGARLRGLSLAEAPQLPLH
jgi:hypothetical protein